MAKKYEVVITPSAQKDLNEIKSYFTNVLKTSSNSIFEKFLEQVRLLKAHPFTYPVHQDPLLKLVGYRVIPIDNYLMFYVVRDNTVQIHRVLYAKRNYTQLLGISKMLHVTDAKYIGDYKISVEFNDGCRFVADFENVIKSDHRPIVQQLADINTFKDFTQQAHTITWSNGVDFAPEFIKSLKTI